MVRCQWVNPSAERGEKTLSALIMGKEVKMPYVIAEPCIGVKDAACVEVCPVDCIYEGTDQYYIHPDECIDCGACVPECPVEAIFEDVAVPEQWQSFVQKNANFFK